MSTKEPTASERHVMIRLGERSFGIPVDIVAEMVQIGRLTTMPQTSPHLRGVMLVRGESVAVHDLRALLGMQPLPLEVADLKASMRAREQDHRNWIEELERSAIEGRPFTLAIDPHKCAFGRWYDTFQSRNTLLQGHLRRFNEPHQRVHAVAAEVDQLVRAGNLDHALARIEATRARELGEMILLFEQLQVLLDAASTEIAVILLSPSGERIAYTVDLVESVQDLHAASESEVASIGGAPLGQRCAFYGPQREIALLLDAHDLLEPDRLRAA
ncbi:MAG: chemotaxis protein CheW [Planctomycetota bacterium]